MSAIDFDAMSDYVESDEFFDEPPAGRTLTGVEARVATRELLASVGGRPNLGQTRAQGKGSSPRRQVRLPDPINNQLDRYSAKTGQTPSQVIRDALERYLADQNIG